MKHTEELNNDNQGPVEDPEALVRGRTRLATVDTAPLHHPDATEEHAAQQAAKTPTGRQPRSDKGTKRTKAAPKATAPFDYQDADAAEKKHIALVSKVYSQRARVKTEQDKLDALRADLQAYMDAH